MCFILDSCLTCHYRGFHGIVIVRKRAMQKRQTENSELYYMSCKINTYTAYGHDRISQHWTSLDISNTHSRVLWIMTWKRGLTIETQAGRWQETSRPSYCSGSIPRRARGHQIHTTVEVKTEPCDLRYSRTGNHDIFRLSVWMENIRPPTVNSCTSDVSINLFKRRHSCESRLRLFASLITSGPKKHVARFLMITNHRAVRQDKTRSN